LTRILLSRKIKKIRVIDLAATNEWSNFKLMIS
jgi:hypothetical protein